MRHPFAGVIKTAHTAENPENSTSRRSLFGMAAAAIAAGTVALLGSGSKAQAQRATTLAVGEEGGRPTTLAVGEEGGRPVKPTTLMLGEEGAGRPPKRYGWKK